jgi:hypothetical protein
MTKERQGLRHRALKGAKIVFHSGTSVIDCVVRDLSASGARLMLPSPGGVPDTFDLCMQSDQSARACRVIWRKHDSIGVEFVDPKQGSAAKE